MPFYPWGKIPKEEKIRCGYGDCKDLATNSCKKCHIPICERHTRKPGLMGNPFSIKLCPDCFNITRERKVKIE